MFSSSPLLALWLGLEGNFGVYELGTVWRKLNRKLKLRWISNASQP